jgi:hypothetical protein
MQSYQCVCNNKIFFDNSQCVACGRELGFCPECRNVAALLPDNEGHLHCGNPQCGVALVKCHNYAEHNVCNRCVMADGAAAGALCDCCRFNDTVPDLTVPGNAEKWYRLEAAKRRLFYDLDLLGLPYGCVADGVQPSLSFDFKADVIPQDNYWRGVGNTEKVFTGHDDGRITINIREADDVEREKLRVEMGEAQRTLLGHFRHEIGHFYWDVLVKGRREPECQAIFGDPNSPTYDQALDAYYKNGPRPDWPTAYISAYATMHPWEDFAETWAAYLDMTSSLDTAHNNGLGGVNDPVHADLDSMVRRYQDLGVAMNEINRSIGLHDAVPDIFVEPVVAKLRFIHELVQQGRAENPIFQSPGSQTMSKTASMSQSMAAGAV